MTNYREILRLQSLGLNHSRIAESMGISRQTMVTTLQRAAAQGLNWQTAEALNDRELGGRLLSFGLAALTPDRPFFQNKIHHYHGGIFIN